MLHIFKKIDIYFVSTVYINLCKTKLVKKLSGNKCKIIPLDSTQANFNYNMHELLYEFFFL